MPDNMRDNLIVSADDFGISKLADVNILKLISEKKVDRVEVMMSPNLNPEEVAQILESGVKIDIHLHLIKEDSDYWYGNRRLKESAVIRLLSFFLNYIFKKTSTEKVELKWAIQIEKFREVFGKNPAGIGSHEYIHFFPPYARAVYKLAKKYEIPYVRIGASDFEHDGAVPKILNWLRKKNLSAFRKSGLASSDYMVSLDWIINGKNCLERLNKNGRTELVCHPEREEELEFIENNL